MDRRRRARATPHERLPPRRVRRGGGRAGARCFRRGRRDGAGTAHGHADSAARATPLPTRTATPSTSRRPPPLPPRRSGRSGGDGDGRGDRAACHPAEARAQSGTQRDRTSGDRPRPDRRHGGRRRDRRHRRHGRGQRRVRRLGRLRRLGRSTSAPGGIVRKAASAVPGRGDRGAVGRRPGAGRRRTVTAPGGTALVVAGAEPQLALAAQQAARSSISKPTTPYAAFRGAARDSG